MLIVLDKIQKFKNAFRAHSRGGPRQWGNFNGNEECYPLAGPHLSVDIKQSALLHFPEIRTQTSEQCIFIQVSFIIHFFSRF